MSAVPAEVMKQYVNSQRFTTTTGIMEAIKGMFRDVLRQSTKNKPGFTGDDSLRKMLYLAGKRIVEHRTGRCQNWDMVMAQRTVMFPDEISA